MRLQIKIDWVVMKVINITLKSLSVLLLIIPLIGYFSWPFFGLPAFVLFYICSALIFCVSCNTDVNRFRGDLYCSIVLISLIIFNIPGFLWYYCGSKALSETGNLNLNVFLLFIRPCLLVLFFVFFTYLSIRFFVGVDDPYRMRAILLVAIVLACLVKPFIYSPSENLFLKGIAKTVNKQLDTSAILGWLQQHEVPPEEPSIPRSSYYLRGVGRILVAVKEQPEYVKQFSNSHDIYVLYSWRKKTFYILRHGSSFSLSELGLTYFDWGVVTGLSPQDISEKIAEDIASGNRIILKVSNDTYVWIYKAGMI